MPGPPHPRLSLSAYVDGRLPTWRRAVLERHLVGCTRCAMEVAQIRALRRLLASPVDPGTPPGLEERLLGIARRDHGQPDPSPRPVDEPAEPAQPAADRVAARPLVGAVGVMAACLLVLGAAGAGSLVTGMTTPAPGTPPRASLTTVLPRLLSWSPDPGGAATVRPVDNGDRP